jgi:4-amino-4-deoxy-L-arabinose transferase-like glycosyltransferase
MPKKLHQITIGLIVFQLIFWTLVPFISHHAPPLDATEMYGWSLTFQWGFYKHPPMPPWFLAVVQALVGRNMFSLFCCASLVISGTYYCVAWLGNRFLSEKEAIVALFLYALVIYCNIWSTDFNHNQMQMPFWALSLVCLVKVMDSGKLSWAFIFGVVMGLNGLSKYTAALIVPSAILLLLISEKWREKIDFQHVVLATLGFLLAFGPHLYWLSEHHFMPFHYVNERFDEMKDSNRFLDLMDFIGNIFLAHIALVFAGIYALFRGQIIQSEDKNNRLFVWVMGVGPVLLTLIIGLFVPLYYRWVIPMLPMISIVVAMWLKGRLLILYNLKAFAIFAILQIALGLSYLYKDQINPGQSNRGNYPAPEIAKQIYQDWHFLYPNQPFKIVAGGEWEAGFVSLFSPEKTYVFTQANTTLAPWITDQDVHDCGMVIIEPTPEELKKYPSAQQSLVMHLRRIKFKDEFEIHYAISPPQGECQLK